MSLDHLTPRHPRPGVCDPPAWQFPTPVISTLDNGLQLWAFHLPGQHVIALDLQIDHPLALEPRDREGVAMMTLNTSDEGTLAHPGAQIAELLEDAGAVYGGHVDHEGTTCTVDVPSTRLSQALPLFAEIVTSPAHHEADVDRHVALRLAQLEQIHAQGAGLANQALRRVSWPSQSRRHRPSGGLADTVSQITRDDVVEFYHRHWTPSASRLLIGGDLSGIDIEAEVATHFGGWHSDHGAPRPDNDEMNAVTNPRLVTLIDRPGSVQVDLRVTGRGVDRHHPDFAALQIGTVAVGGSFLSRLNRVLREERGYTYGISLGASPHRVGGQWTFSGSFRTEVAVAALTEAHQILDLNDAPLTEAEVDDARSQIVGLAPLRYDTPAAVIGQAARLAQVGLDTDQVNRHYRAVAAVQPDQATAAFARHINPSSGHVVMVGDASVLTGQLETAGHQVELLVLD